MRILFLVFVNSILSKSRVQQTIICFCILRSLQYRLILNQCFPFEILYFAYHGGQWFCYGSEDLCDALNTKYATSRTVDTPLTLISRMRQGACRYCVCQWRLPKFDKWMSATNRNINCPRSKGKHCWRSVDTHSQNGVVTVLLSLLQIEAANISVIHTSNQSTN